MNSARHWLWRAVDEHGFVQGILLQRHRDTESAKTFPTRLLGEDDVPEVIHTDQLHSYGAALRECPSLINVGHQQVISTARHNNVIKQRASGAVLPNTTAGVQAEETSARIPQRSCTNREPLPSLPYELHRCHPKKQLKRSRRGRRSLQGRPEAQAIPALGLP